MAREFKLYAIYKNRKHVGNAGATTPRRAIWCYCYVAKLPCDYETYKAKKAVAGKHYVGRAKLDAVDIIENS